MSLVKLCLNFRDTSLLLNCIVYVSIWTNHVCFWNWSVHCLWENSLLKSYRFHISQTYNNNVLLQNTKYIPAYKILVFKILSKIFSFELVLIWLCWAGFVMWIYVFQFCLNSAMRHQSNLNEHCKGVFLANLKEWFVFWETDFETIWIYACFQYTTYHAANVVFNTVNCCDKIEIENDDWNPAIHVLVLCM